MGFIPLHNAGGRETPIARVCIPVCVCWCMLSLGACSHVSVRVNCTRVLGLCCPCGFMHCHQHQARPALALHGQTPQRQILPPSDNLCQGKEFFLPSSTTSGIPSASRGVHFQQRCHFSSGSCMMMLTASCTAKPAQAPQQHGLWASGPLSKWGNKRAVRPEQSFVPDGKDRCDCRILAAGKEQRSRGCSDPCCWPRSIVHPELQVGIPCTPLLAAASRLPSAMGLCQEWSQVLCSWINPGIWAAA